MTYNERDFIQILKRNGYILQPKRGKGSHHLYKKGARSITVGNSFNKMVIRRLIKEYELEV